MQQILKKIFIVVLIVFAKNTFAQNIGVSPYSQIGIGDLANESYSRNVSMGGAGLASSSSFYINALNPALNINNSTVIYEFGLVGQVKNLQTNTVKDYATAGNLNYIGLLFPVKSKYLNGKRINQWGMGIGIKPFSAVNYSNTISSPVIGDTIKTSILQKGSGGLNQVYVSNGFRINDKLSLGLNTAYLFGPILKESIIDLAGSYVDIAQRNNVSSVWFKPGFNYKKQLGQYDSAQVSSKTFFSVAGTVDIFTGLNSSTTTETRRVDQNDFIIRRDTLSSGSNFSSQLPIHYNLGFSFDHFGNDQAQKWSLVADFSYADWSNYSNFGVNAGMGKAFSAKFGAEFTPTFVATKSFFNRLTYRGGFYFQHTPVVYLNNEIIDFGLTAGLALSIPRTLTNFNIGFALGQKGTLTNNGIQEQYIKMYLGVNINDIWFFKRQLN
jgi:hypothetical protein